MGTAGLIMKLLILSLLLGLVAFSTPLELSQDMNQFTINFYKKLNEGDPVGNILFSPFSLHTALSMALEGSEESSATHQELAKLLLHDDNLSLDSDYHKDISQVHSKLNSNDSICLYTFHKQ